ncbi:MAG: VCBS repeat-containing protein [Bacteroidia bacterium]|nr:VCBS repeat-containing protein [Bacteroidia bacterium]
MNVSAIRVMTGCLWALMLVWGVGCNSDALTDNKADQSKSKAKARWELLNAEQTGLNFNNVLDQTSEFNVFNYMYFYNGGGLAAGDFNNDGKVDLYFTSNMGPNMMFLNESENGEIKFKDITEQAGVAGPGGWKSGVSVVDINNDGMLDLYVSQIGEYQTIRGENQLFVCQGIENGIPVYQNEAYVYGLNLKVFGTQASFFDYDQDGDLDMYQLNHSLHGNGTFGQKKTFENKKHPESGDKLLRNDNGRFVEVTEEAGINSTVIGYGLGVATGDVNQDGWPDIYIGNDFHENDYLYINQKDGTFKEVLTEQMRHTSRFSMGVEISDLNNDALPEIFSLDMLPEDPAILKASLGEDAYGIYTFKLGYGYNHQFSRNNLQLNNGNNTFTEIGLFADIYATDWSWSPVFMDFDHDGYKDLFISNGIPRRMNDIDYVNFRANNDLRWKQNTNNLDERDLSMIDKMPQIKLKNKFFRNEGDLHFQDMTGMIKNDAPTYSNGTVYADFDNDGDLDIAVNNIEDAPFIYKNLQGDSSQNTYLDLRLEGTEKNPLAIGAKAIAFKGNQTLVQEHYLVKGYQSSHAPGLHLGLGKAEEVDSVLLIWPDNSYQSIPKSQFGEKIILKYQKGLPAFDYSTLSWPNNESMAFEDVTAKANLNFKHDENPFVEFNRETLIPHMVSREGPGLAIADVDGDGYEDFFVGSSKRKRSQLFYQTPKGKFVEKTPQAIINDSLWEDVDAAWVDIENDGDLDLVVASGGNEYWGKNKALKQRVYINKGKGEFESRLDMFGETYLTAASVLPSDINGDGYTDLIFAARAVPWKYGVSPESYLFINQKDGSFEDKTSDLAPDLRRAGLVKKGIWTDIDKDGDDDLILALEWESLKIFLNEGGKLKLKKVNDLKGWWNMVLAGDFDGDGDIDLLAGNTGKNSKFKPSEKEPLRLYVGDYDTNDKMDQLLTYYINGKEVPFHNYTELTQQLPYLKKKYLYAKDFAAASPSELIGAEEFAKAQVLEVNYLESVFLENTGDLEFKAHPLPDELQFSTINAGEVVDLDNDGKKELLLAGNFYECNIEMGRYDGNYGNVLRIGPNGTFESMPFGKLNLDGQVRYLKPIKVKGKESFILAKNNDYLQLIQGKAIKQ